MVPAGARREPAASCREAVASDPLIRQSAFAASIRKASSFPVAKTGSVNRIRASGWTASAARSFPSATIASRRTRESGWPSADRSAPEASVSPISPRIEQRLRTKYHLGSERRERMDGTTTAPIRTASAIRARRLFASGSLRRRSSSGSAAIRPDRARSAANFSRSPGGVVRARWRSMICP